MNAPPTVDDPIIQAERLAFSYPGASVPAVADLTFAVQRHEIFGFLGPSGAGKSTTQNVLIGLLSGYQGSVNVLGRDLRTWDRSYYRRIGVAFEAPNHYLKLTARENLQLFSGLHGGETEDPDAILEHVGLREVAGFARVRSAVGGDTRQGAAADPARSARFSSDGEGVRSLESCTRLSGRCHAQELSGIEPSFHRGHWTQPALGIRGSWPCRRGSHPRHRGLDRGDPSDGY